MKLWHRFIHPITSYFRQKRGQFLFKQFPEMRSYKICDLGGSRHFWEKLNLDIPAGHITVFNISDAETSAIAGGAENDIHVVLYDGKHLPVKEGTFDLLVCNSVMEHVPPTQRAALVSEMRRVAKHIFCQTPAYEFFIEPHFIVPFIHWLPRWLGFQISKISPWRLLSRSSAATLHSYWWNTKLLSEREIRALFPYAEILKERTMGLTKSYYVIEQQKDGT